MPKPSCLEEQLKKHLNLSEISASGQQQAQEDISAEVSEVKLTANQKKKLKKQKKNQQFEN